MIAYSYFRKNYSVDSVHSFFTSLMLFSNPNICFSKISVHFADFLYVTYILKMSVNTFIDGKVYFE